MLAYAAAMQGESREAADAVHELLSSIPHEYVERDVNRVDFYFALPYQLHMRFGNWKAMLAEPPPQSDLPIAQAMYHLGRGVAFAARNELEDAKYERAVFLGIVQSFPQGATFRKNDARSMFKIAYLALDGQILYRQGKRDQALAELRQAVQSEDSLQYMEPPDWIESSRHLLGALLLDAGRDAEAESVYKEDLRRHPENGWSLYGLARCLRKQKNTQAEAVAARSKAAWKYADVPLTSSTLRLPTVGPPSMGPTQRKD